MSQQGRAGRQAPPARDGEYTIDELAQASQVTVRNIRAHQSRGLLPAPEVRGRTGFYTGEHLARLQLISEMQADGFNLSAVKRILDGMPPGSAGEVLGFERALRAPWGSEEPEIMNIDELQQMLPGGDDSTVRRAAKLGLMVPLGDGRFEIISPVLLRAGAQLGQLGVDVNTRLAVEEQVKRHTDAIAGAFTRLFLEKVWKPFHDAGRPEAEWPRIRAALDMLRPLSTDVTVSTFNLSMTAAVDQAFGKVIQQEVKVKAEPKRPRRDKASPRHESSRPGRRRSAR